jgi:hypothetical protein
MVRDFTYVLHLESDFEHLPQEITGEDKMWLHRALDFMESGECCYLYGRRITGEKEMMLHWWSKWMERLQGEGPYLRCFGFKWSNNPHLRKNESIYKAGTLPLDITKDGAKGTANWCRPELEALPIPKPWIHKWGLFVHELPKQPEVLTKKGCGMKPFGCKYGFFRDGQDAFCRCCDRKLDFRDMKQHEHRFGATQ